MLGLTMSEGSIHQWLKNEGDTVRKGEPLFEVETDKAIMEVEAPEDGTLAKILVQPDCLIAVGEVVGLITQAGESMSGPEPAASSAPKAGISPRARRLAEQHGIDWQSIDGSGADGQVTEADIRAHISDAPKTVEPEAKPLSRTRQVIAERLHRSIQECVHIYLTVAVDMTQAKAACAGTFSISDLLLHAAGRCLVEFPAVNSSLVDGRVQLHPTVNIGFAVAVSDDALVVPVLRNADRLSLDAISSQRRALVDKAIKRQLTLDEMSGGTFTISNLGMYGVEQFTAIINPPESGILAIGAIAEEPCVVNGVIAIRSVMRVTLAVDHRVIDGALAAKFLQRLKALLEART